MSDDRRISTALTNTSSSASTGTPTRSSAKETHTIQVGPKQDPHSYVPHSVDAKVGDLIVFEFYPRNHSVVQADWKAPCVPADGDYFFSGIKNDFDEVNGQVVGVLPTWNWTVESTEPTFFYCTATDSCIGNGMVGVINPNKTQTWESQYKAAFDAPYMLLPGQSIPAEGDEPGSGTTATHSDPSNSSPSTASTSSPSHLGGGAIAGIIVGSVAFVLILCGLLFLLGRNRVYKKWLYQSHEGSGASSAKERTARWALSTAAAVGPGTNAGSGNGNGNSDGDANSTGFPGQAGSPEGANGHGHGHAFVPINRGLQQTHRQSGIYSYADGSYAYSSPPLGPQMQSAPVQQQPYWIWDQSVQPYQLVNRHEGPSELEAENNRR
ncbi:hypothetical protein BDV18DRAFT_161211 [Aspergillus unguis]